MTAKHYAYLNILQKELSLLGILLRRNPFVSNSFDFSKVRGLSFYEYWVSYYRENWYDFQLKDLSLLSFYENDSKEVTYLYIGSPVKCAVTEEEYYLNADSFMSGVTYDDYVLACPKVENAPYLRYDNASSQYNAGLHPANHLHFGYGQNNRVGSIYHLDAIAFIAIVLRQFYPDYWKLVLDNHEKYSLLFTYKSRLEMIDKDYYCELDNNHDLYLK